MNLWFEWHCLTERANKAFRLLREGGEMLTGRESLLLKDQMWALFAWELETIADNILFIFIKKSKYWLFLLAKVLGNGTKYNTRGCTDKFSKAWIHLPDMFTLLRYIIHHFINYFSIRALSVMGSLNLAHQKIYSSTIWWL